MANPLFVVSPLYLAVGIVIAVLVVQEYLKYGLPQRHAVRRRPHHHHDRSQDHRHHHDHHPDAA